MERKHHNGVFHWQSQISEDLTQVELAEARICVKANELLFIKLTT